MEKLINVNRLLVKGRQSLLVSSERKLWYVSEAEPGTFFYYGFIRDIEPDRFYCDLQNGVEQKHMNRVKAEPNNVFSIDPGIPHMICGNAVVWEVALIDALNRKLDLSSKDACLDIVWSAAEEPRQPMRVMNYRHGFGFESLGFLSGYAVSRILLNFGEVKQYSTEQNQTIACISGRVTVAIDKKAAEICQGDWIHIRQKDGPEKIVTIFGKAELLQIMEERS